MREGREAGPEVGGRGEEDIFKAGRGGGQGEEEGRSKLMAGL